jgi:hypothetical protein
MRSSLITLRNVISPFIDPLQFIRAIGALPRYLGDAMRYRRMASAEPLSRWKWHPVLGQATATTGFDPHYVNIGEWAMRHIAHSAAPEHIDVGSQINWVTCLSCVTKVVFIDIRPLDKPFTNLESRAGSILEMPFPDQSVQSLSSLHVAEHIGLGRYGDPLDPQGTRKAITELARIVAPGGKLYFGLPVGQPRVFFNAHRVHDPEDIANWFAEEGLELIQFTGVDDSGTRNDNAKPVDYKTCRYACGMYALTRPEK